MSDRELAVRREVMASFARDGAPPEGADPESLVALASRRVVVLDEEDPGRIVMAHPFAAPGAGTKVATADGTWWGNCAWDGLGIVAALGLEDVRITSAGFELDVRSGQVVGDALFHVAVPARRWWEDIAFT